MQLCHYSSRLAFSSFNRVLQSYFTKKNTKRDKSNKNNQKKNNFLQSNLIKMEYVKPRRSDILSKQISKYRQTNHNQRNLHIYDNVKKSQQFCRKVVNVLIKNQLKQNKQQNTKQIDELVEISLFEKITKNTIACQFENSLKQIQIQSNEENDLNLQTKLQSIKYISQKTNNIVSVIDKYSLLKQFHGNLKLSKQEMFSIQNIQGQQTNTNFSLNYQLKNLFKNICMRGYQQEGYLQKYQNIHQHKQKLWINNFQYNQMKQLRKIKVNNKVIYELQKKNRGFKQQIKQNMLKNKCQITNLKQKFTFKNVQFNNKKPLKGQNNFKRFQQHIQSENKQISGYKQVSRHTIYYNNSQNNKIGNHFDSNSRYQYNGQKDLSKLIQLNKQKASIKKQEQSKYSNKFTCNEVNITNQIHSYSYSKNTKVLMQKNKVKQQNHSKRQYMQKRIIYNPINQIPNKLSESLQQQQFKNTTKKKASNSRELIQNNIQNKSESIYPIKVGNLIIQNKKNIYLAYQSQNESLRNILVKFLIYRIKYGIIQVHLIIDKNNTLPKSCKAKQLIKILSSIGAQVKLQQKQMMSYSKGIGAQVMIYSYFSGLQYNQIIKALNLEKSKIR